MDLSQLGESLALPDLPDTMARVEDISRELILSGDRNLAAPCLRIFDAPGKRLRPALVMASAACGGQTVADDTLLSAGAAVELVHTASLVHDDMMDGGHDRRGVPSISSREGPDTALLCGDYLLALAGFAAATVSREVGREIARTIVALCGGQIQELMENFNPFRSRASIVGAIEGKTAALFRTACYVGGICAGLPQVAVEALAGYGRAVGMCFQIVDDVLDFVSSRQLSGKPVMNDLRSGVYTLPVAFARAGERGPELVEMLRADSRPTRGYPGGAIRLGETQLQGVIALLRSGNNFRRTVDVALTYADEAAERLACLADVPTARGMARLPRFYVEEQLRTKVADEVLGRELIAVAVP